MRALIIILVACLASVCYSQPYPNKPVKIVVPLGPGGGNDLATRIVGQKLSEIWQVPVVVENKPGADAMIGTSFVAKSEPDGYTLLSIAISQIASASVILNDKTLVNWEKDLAVVGILGYTPPFVIATSSKNNVKSLKELKEFGKNKGITYGSVGEGSPYHIYGDLILRTMKTEGIRVTYKSVPQALVDILNGTLDIIICPETQVMQHMNNGNINILAVIGDKPSHELPNVPTTQSLGYDLPKAPLIYNIFVPINTPPEIQRKITEGVEKATALAIPELTQRKLIGRNSIPPNVNEFSTNLGKTWMKLTERAIKNE